MIGYDSREPLLAKSLFLFPSRFIGSCYVDFMDEINNYNIYNPYSELQKEGSFCRFNDKLILQREEVLSKDLEETIKSIGFAMDRDCKDVSHEKYHLASIPKCISENVEMYLEPKVKEFFRRDSISLKEGRSILNSYEVLRVIVLSPGPSDHVIVPYGVDRLIQDILNSSELIILEDKNNIIDNLKLNQ